MKLLVLVADESGRLQVHQSRLSSRSRADYTLAVQGAGHDSIMNSKKRTPWHGIRSWFSRAPCFLLFVILGTFASAHADSDAAHVAAHSKKPLPWPDGIVPYDISKLTED